MKTKLQFTILGTILIIFFTPLFGQTVFTVTNTNDSGAGSLRQAILDANGTAGTDTIAFDIPGAGPHTIQPTSALPTITDPVVIDGTTEPDFAGTPIVELDGTNAGSANGLSIFDENSTVRGLVINRFTNTGISLYGNGGNVIEGNFIGTDITGTFSLGNGLSGVNIESPTNTIGGTLPGTRNVISGNATGVLILGSNASDNLVIGNYIGTDVTGTLAVPNQEHGVQIVINASNNIIGGTTESARNVISGNGEEGVKIQAGAFGNFVQGNFIGTDFTGTAALANEGFGAIFIESQNNTIGGAIPGARNVISGNAGSGVLIRGSNATNNLVIGNYIGTDVSGTVALGGQIWNGVAINDGARFNTIGGTTVEERNIISGNEGAGITISDSGTTGNIVIGNFIGTDVTGTDSIGNGGHGVFINDASNNIIGGTTDEVRNIISANQQYGVRIQGNNAQGNLVQGNYIGTDANGMAAFPNLSGGIAIRYGASNNIIGGTETGARNVVSGNNGSGFIIGDGTNSNVIQGNYIGTDATGEGALGNGSDGIVIFFDAVDNIVGGDEGGAENIIAFNGGTGILLDNTSATVRNRLSRNSIFSNAEIGIDLSLNPNPPWRDGVTPNDPGDPDTGPNNLQNFPVITSTGIDINGDLLIGYNVDSDPVNSTFPLTIEFFESDTCGQGETFVGADQYTVTDFNNGGKTVNIGNAGGLGITDGDIIVATATDSVGNTSEFSSLDTVVTDISLTINHLPESYALYQNYPNPFNPVSKIKYDIPQISFVTLKVYDVLGSEIITLVNEEKSIGTYELTWYAENLPSGIYFYRLQVYPANGGANEFTQVKKMILLK